AVGSSAISIQRSITSRLANYSDCSGLSCRFGFCNWLDSEPVPVEAARSLSFPNNLMIPEVRVNAHEPRRHPGIPVG
ncbi:MAG: hypothetical protein FWD57_09075, partial [Polyangiaceae bacterium]|nr:hypothetical protein [Polyangiaceae bacterium]